MYRDSSETQGTFFRDLLRDQCGSVPSGQVTLAKNTSEVGTIPSDQTANEQPTEFMTMKKIVTSTAKRLILLQSLGHLQLYCCAICHQQLTVAEQPPGALCRPTCSSSTTMEEKTHILTRSILQELRDIDMTSEEHQLLEKALGQSDKNHGEPHCSTGRNPGVPGQQVIHQLSGKYETEEQRHHHHQQQQYQQQQQHEKWPQHNNQQLVISNGSHQQPFLQNQNRETLTMGPTMQRHHQLSSSGRPTGKHYGNTVKPMVTQAWGFQQPLNDQDRRQQFELSNRYHQLMFGPQQQHHARQPPQPCKQSTTYDFRHQHNVQKSGIHSYNACTNRINCLTQQSQQVQLNNLNQPSSKILSQLPEPSHELLSTSNNTFCGRHVAGIDLKTSICSRPSLISKSAALLTTEEDSPLFPNLTGASNTIYPCSQVDRVLAPPHTSRTDGNSVNHISVLDEEENTFHEWNEMIERETRLTSVVEDCSETDETFTSDFASMIEEAAIPIEQAEWEAAGAAAMAASSQHTAAIAVIRKDGVLTSSWEEYPRAFSLSANDNSTTSPPNHKLSHLQTAPHEGSYPLSCPSELNTKTIDLIDEHKGGKISLLSTNRQASDRSDHVLGGHNKLRKVDIDAGPEGGRRSWEADENVAGSQYRGSGPSMGHGTEN